MIKLSLGASLTQNLNAQNWRDDHRPDIGRHESAECKVLAVQWHPEELASLVLHSQLLEYYAGRISTATN